MEILRELWDFFLVKMVVAIVGPVIAAILWWLLRWLYRARTALHLINAARKSVERHENNGVREEGPGFWLRRPVLEPPRYDDLAGNSIPILMIAATKGGVGKTSLAGSLAAHFAQRWTQRRQDEDVDKPLRVLVVDQDFQGSFSTMTVSVDSRYTLPSKANSLVSGDLGGGAVADQAERISQPGMESPLSIWTIPAYYDLAQAENRTLIEWLLPLSDAGLFAKLLRLLRGNIAPAESQVRDARYALAEALLDPKVQRSFDLVIIDSPPRLTTSHIQAMCASTSLLVPTILDGLSGDAVGRYLEQVATHVKGPNGRSDLAICRHLQTIGIVATIVPRPSGDLSGRINELRSRVAEARVQPEIVPEDCFICHRAQYREHAGERIAYAAVSQDRHHRELREEVDRLGLWLAPRLGAAKERWTQRGP